MAQTKMGWALSLSLLAENRAETKEQSPLGSALSSALVSALGVALQRCSYPPHECHQSTIANDTSPAKGTSLLCKKGDISILH
jgi:hypothetical protein